MNKGELEMLQKRGGFTIVELLIVLSITVVLAVAALPIYSNFQVSSQLNDNSALIAQKLRIARQLSIVRYNGSAHGVYFEINSGSQDRVVLYQGTSYGTRDSNYDQPTVLDEPLSLTTTLSGNDVNFSEGRGLPNNTGTVTLAHQSSGNRTVEINAIGKVDEN